MIPEGYRKWHGTEITGYDGTSYSDRDKAPFHRWAAPYKAKSFTGDDSIEDEDSWMQGYRALSDDEIEELAISIVEHIKDRGPFYSMSHFVNRVVANYSAEERYTDNLNEGLIPVPGDDDDRIDLEKEYDGEITYRMGHAQKGVLQAAIDWWVSERKQTRKKMGELNRIMTDGLNAIANVEVYSDYNESGIACFNIKGQDSTIVGDALAEKFDIVINVQGDEPFIQPEQLLELKECFNDSSVNIATLVKKIETEEELRNNNTPKVVIDKNMNALYFSRTQIPFARDCTVTGQFIKEHCFYKHIGLYGYRCQTLEEICSLPQSYLEKTEKLEQLRWLENGYRIRVAVTGYMTHAVDTPQDLEYLNSDDFKPTF